MDKIIATLLIVGLCLAVPLNFRAFDTDNLPSADTSAIDSIVVSATATDTTYTTYNLRGYTIWIDLSWPDSVISATAHWDTSALSWVTPRDYAPEIALDSIISRGNTAWTTATFDTVGLARTSELISVGEIWGYGSRTLTDTAEYTWFIDNSDSFKATLDTAYIPEPVGTYQLDIYSYLSTDSSVISGAWVAIYSSGEIGETPLWNTNTSSDSGLARVNVDAGTYDIRATKAGYYGIDTSLTVSSDTDCKLYIDQTAWPVAPDTQYCMVIFDAIDLGVSVPEGEQVKIKIQSIPQYYDGAGITTREVTATYDAAGRASASLIRGAGVRVSIPALGFIGTGTVPDTSAIGWRDYYPAGGTTRWLIQR